MKLVRTFLLGLYVAIAAPLVGTLPQFDGVGLVAPAHATTTGLSNADENSFVDFYLRGQTWSGPATIYFGLATETCDDAGPGTEPSSGAYARVAVTASLANFAGTQSAGSTTASSGTGGTTSNNGAITFPTSTGAWASGANLQSVRTYTASSGGTQRTCIDLTTPFPVPGSGVTLSFAAGSWQFTIN